MRITCEECQATYFISSQVIGPNGRTVKCAKCSRTWMVKPQESSIKNSQSSHSSIGPLFSGHNFDFKINLPTVFRPTLPTFLKILPAILSLLIMVAGLTLYPETFIKYSVIKNLYQKMGIYDAKDLVLHNFTIAKTEGSRGIDVMIRGIMINNSDQVKIVPDIRYVILNKEHDAIFKFTNVSPGKMIKAGETLPIESKVTNLSKNAGFIQLDIGNKLELMLRN